MTADSPASALAGDKQATSHDSSSENKETSSTSLTPKSATTSTSSSVTASTEHIIENPFDNAESRALFEAIDQLQSCKIHKYQQIEIPQLVIVGGQSSGKSSLVRSLTDIPLPVGYGTCTRFATRIVSKRTAPNTRNHFEVTIDDPEVEIPGFDIDEDAKYKAYKRKGETLSAAEYGEIIGDVSANYLGIRPGNGPEAKNFAPQVLRIELSGPLRSHFSILDVPGTFTNDEDVRKGEMEGVTNMVTQYLRSKENLVVCVADGAQDTEHLGIKKMIEKAEVEGDRLIGVLTKCDRTDQPARRVQYAQKARGKAWFVVRNRHGTEDRNFNLSSAEDTLFSTPPWNLLPKERRGTSNLRTYLSNILSNEIRLKFPSIMDEIKRQLQEAEVERGALGQPLTTMQDKERFLRRVFREYENIARESLNTSWLLDDKMQVRKNVSICNDKFFDNLYNRGHSFPFEKTDPHLIIEVERMLQTRDSQSIASNTGLSNQNYKSPNQKITKAQKDEAAARSLRSVIKDEVKLFKGSLELELVHPDMVKNLFIKQTTNWRKFAHEHLQAVSEVVHGASKAILQRVGRSVAPGNSILQERLLDALQDRFTTALDKSWVELNDYCELELSEIHNTDPRYSANLKRMRIMRWQQNLEALKQSMGENLQLSDALTLYDHFHNSVENNMANDVHDILKCYYDITIENFKRRVTSISENFVKSPKGPLLGLSQAWSDELKDGQILYLAIEDANTAAKRTSLDNKLKMLKEAHVIAEKAINRTI